LDTRKLAKNIEIATIKERDMGKLEGKVALITGGNSGIGLATAKRFVSEGADVFITGRREAELAAAVRDIGKNVTGVQGDVAKLADLDRLFAQVKREKGKLDNSLNQLNEASTRSFLRFSSPSLLRTLET
jgi:NAD(P)-dependent dehydrogenase (short-subunit alcohol dehydrogenase family)